MKRRPSRRDVGMCRSHLKVKRLILLLVQLLKNKLHRPINRQTNDLLIPVDPAIAVQLLLLPLPLIVQNFETLFRRTEVSDDGLPAPVQPDKCEKNKSKREAGNCQKRDNKAALGCWLIFGVIHVAEPIREFEDREWE